MQTVIAARRADDEEELLVVDTDDPQTVRLTLDDGESIDVDRTELLAALNPQTRHISL